MMLTFASILLAVAILSYALGFWRGRKLGTIEGHFEQQVAEFDRAAAEFEARRKV